MKKVLSYVSVLAVATLAGCMQVGNPPVDKVVMISCTDLRDGEKFSFMNTKVSKYVRGLTDEYITFTDNKGLERTVSGKVFLEQMKCTKTAFQEGSA